MLLFTVVFLIIIPSTKSLFLRGMYFLHLAIRSFPRGGKYPLRVCLRVWERRTLQEGQNQKYAKKSKKKENKNFFRHQVHAEVAF